MSLHLPVFLLALGVAVSATAIVIPLARRLGLVAKPRADRWHRQSTALMGGIGIFLAFAASCAVYAPFSRNVALVLGGAAAAFFFGLYDDLRETRPGFKLLFQILLATTVSALGLRIGFIANPFLATGLTVFWIVAIINAFNIIDNMDGLSSGIAAVSGICIFVYSVQLGNAEVSVLAAAVSAACLGFFIFNFNPAKIFMGDCGSLCIGFIMAAITIMSTWRSATNLLFSICTPVCFLAIPIFDTLLVSFQRRLHGRPISMGGRDHTSHRLVVLGLSERKTVLLLMVISLCCGLSGAFFDRFGPLGTIALFGALAVFMILFGLFLAEVRVYGTATLSMQKGLLGACLRFLHKHALTMAVDAILLAVAYIVSYLLRFEGVVTGSNLELMWSSLPVIVAVKMAVFLIAGLYRHDWKRAGLRAFSNQVKANVLASVAAIFAVLLLYRFQGFSRALFVVDFTMAMVLTTVARFYPRIFGEYILGRSDTSGAPTFIDGADDAGENLLRTLRARPDLAINVVGFLDDDPEQERAIILSVPVLGKWEDLPQLAEDTGAKRVLIPERPGSLENLAGKVRIAAGAGVTVEKVTLAIVRLDEDVTSGEPCL